MTGVARATSLDAGLTGRRVLVTAGAAGIGLAIVERLLAHEASVFVCDVNDATLHSFNKAHPQPSPFNGAILRPASLCWQPAVISSPQGGLEKRRAAARNS